MELGIGGSYSSILPESGSRRPMRLGSRSATRLCRRPRRPCRIPMPWLVHASVTIARPRSVRGCREGILGDPGELLLRHHPHRPRQTWPRRARCRTLDECGSRRTRPARSGMRRGLGRAPGSRPPRAPDETSHSFPSRRCPRLRAAASRQQGSDDHGRRVNHARHHEPPGRTTGADHRAEKLIEAVGAARSGRPS